MTSQAVAHAHGHALINQVHCLHLAVACLAQDPGNDVRPVIEIHVVGQRMYPLPLQRRARRKDGGDLLDVRTLLLGHLVTVHARLNGRNSSEARSKGAGMAILARNPEDTRMQLVGIRNRLFGPVSAHQTVRLRVPPHAQNCGQNGDEAGGQDESGVVNQSVGVPQQVHVKTPRDSH